MRVTNRIIAGNLTKAIAGNLGKLAKTQEQLATGKIMNRPSDRPENISQLLSVKGALSYMEQHNRNLDDGLSYLSLNDSSMQNLGDILHQASETAIQGAQGSYTQADLAALAEQIDGMINQVVDLANTSVGGRYIFAGTRNNRPPFHREGDSILYTGDQNGIYREVLSGENYRIDAPGITLGFEVLPVVTTSASLPAVTQRQVPSKLENTGIFTITRTETGFTIENPTRLDGVTAVPNLATSFSVTGDVITIDGVTDELEGLTIDMSGTSVGDQYKVVIDNQLGVFGHGAEIQPGVYEVYNPTVIKDHRVDEGIFDTLFKLRDRLRQADTGIEIEPLVSASNVAPDVVRMQFTEKIENTGMFTITFTAPDIYTISDELKLDGVTANDSLVAGYTAEDRLIWKDGQLTTRKILAINGAGSEFEGLEIDLTGLADGDQYRVVIDGGIESSIKEINDRVDSLLQKRVGIGSRTRHFEALKDQILDLETKLTESESKLEDADIYKLSISMSQEQVTFQASLASGANILQVSLLDFLK